MLQDGRSVSIGKNVTDRVLYVQDCFKGRIFIGSIIKKIQEICQVRMERPVIQIFMFMLWSLFSAKSFTKLMSQHIT